MSFRSHLLRALYQIKRTILTIQHSQLGLYSAPVEFLRTYRPSRCGLREPVDFFTDEGTTDQARL